MPVFKLQKQSADRLGLRDRELKFEEFQCA